MIHFNGIHGATGTYGHVPMEEGELAELILARLSGLSQGKPERRFLKELETLAERWEGADRGLGEGMDPTRLDQAGWGVVFAGDADPAIRESLGPLLALRREQAGGLFRIFDGTNGYQGESARDFLERHGVAPGLVDPAQIPFYLLLVGNPSKIPYDFELEMGLRFAVGRVDFGDLDAYARYARSVVEAETKPRPLPRQMGVFGTAHPEDPWTRRCQLEFLEPLLAHHRSRGRVIAYLADDARKVNLSRLLGGDATAPLVLAACHGMEFSPVEPRQARDQGALVCQEWSGPQAAPAPVTPDVYFSSTDLERDADLLGRMAFLSASFSGGVPRMDDLAGLRSGKRSLMITRRESLARLPLDMLSHPGGGALAVLCHHGRIGHIERSGKDLWGGFASVVDRLLDGQRIGLAVGPLKHRYATLEVELADEIERIRSRGRKTDIGGLAALWTAHNDVRSAMVLGDPATRLLLDDTAEEIDPTASSQAAAEAEPAVAAGLLADIADGEDRLGLGGEIRALSEVIAAREAQPPLAVGLLGAWGSGKSFFMSKMRRQIEVIAEEAQLDELVRGLGELAQALPDELTESRQALANDLRSLLARGRRLRSDSPSQVDRANDLRRSLRDLGDAVWLERLAAALAQLGVEEIPRRPGKKSTEQEMGEVLSFLRDAPLATSDGGRVSHLKESIRERLRAPNPGDLRELLRQATDEIWLVVLNEGIRAEKDPKLQAELQTTIQEASDAYDLEDFREARRWGRKLWLRCAALPEATQKRLLGWTGGEAWNEMPFKLDQLSGGGHPDDELDRRGEDRPREDHPFCGQIAQIEFNAWHYAESNLWASLVTRIFDGLAAHVGAGTQKGEIAEHRRRLVQRLETTRSLESDAKDQLREASCRAVWLARQYREHEAEALRRRKSWAKAARQELGNWLKGKKVDETLKALGVERDSIDGLRQTVAEIGSFQGRLKAFVLAVPRGPGRSGRLALLALALLLLGYGPEVVAWASAAFGDQTVPWLAWLRHWESSAVAMFLYVFQQVRFFGRAVDLARRADEQVRNEFAVLDDEDREKIEGLRAEAESARLQASQASIRLGLAQEETQQALQEVRDAESGRRFYRFIEERSDASDYHRHLGLITLIRKDFENLRKMIEDYTRNRWSGDVRGVERIVLYVDDLDRCDDRRVVDVLQAIHLLMAIELFVVVVAVDPRWLLNALEKIYPQFKDQGDRERLITPYDYLEKIFQIPFELPAMSAPGFNHLVDSLAPAVEAPHEVIARTEEPEGGPVMKQAFPQKEEGSESEPGSLAEPAEAAPPKPVVADPLHSDDERDDIPRAEREDRRRMEILRHKRQELRFSPEENQFIKELRPLVPTPRALKRLVNVYRLLRVLKPPEDRPPLLQTVETTQDYKAVLFLLAAQIRRPEVTRDLLSKLREPDTPKKWSELLQAQEAWKDRWLPPGLPEDLSVYRAWLVQVRRFSFDTNAS